MSAQMTESSEEEGLPAKYIKIPLDALNPGTRKKLSLYLNLEGTLNDDVQCENNYRGLAELAGFSYLEIKNFEMKKSPTEEMLDDWTVRNELSPTMGQLWSFLSLLGRDDVLTDCRSYIYKDCEVYLERKARFVPAVAPIQEPTVTQSTDVTQRPHNEPMSVTDVVEGTPTLYDAFICYNAEGDDLEFVKLLIHKLEDEYGMKLFVPERDDLPGSSASTTCAKLIQQRCKRMVIILSPRFLVSPSCDFQTKFAHSLSPGSRSKKLVPILIERCVIPEILRHVTLCDYTKKDLLQWFWSRLAQSLKAPLDCEEENLGNLLLMRDQSSSSYSWTSDSSLSGSSSLGSTSSSSSSSMSHSPLPSRISQQQSSNRSHSPKPSSSYRAQAQNRSNSPGLSSQQVDGYILVDRSCSPRPKLPPVDNRAPLPRTGCQTPTASKGTKSSPKVKGANSSPKNRAFNSLHHDSGSGTPPLNRGAGTPPLRRPLPELPVYKKDENGEKVYFC